MPGRDFADSRSDRSNGAAPNRSPNRFFGHSLGAAIAYEAALSLEDTLPGVRLSLFVSGRPAPQFDRGGRLHLATDERLCADIVRLGGTRPEVLDNSELRQIVLTILRKDYQLSETYQPRTQSQLRASIMACLGDRDPEVTTAEARGWAECTSGRFDMRVFAGDHFYLTRQGDSLMRTIVNFLLSEHDV